MGRVSACRSGRGCLSHTGCGGMACCQVVAARVTAADGVTSQGGGSGAGARPGVCRRPGVPVLERPVQRVPEVAAEPARVCGRLGDHLVDDAVGGEVGGTDALAGGEFWGVAGVAVDDGAGAFGRQRGEPGVLGGQDAVSGQQGQCRAAGSLPEQERDGGDREVVRSARHPAISLARPSSSARADSSAPGVSITQTSGSRSPAARRAPRLAWRRAAGPGGGPWRSWAMSTHG